MITEINNISPNTAVISTSGIDGDISDNFKLDRYLGNTLILPYTFEEVRIKSNELCVADNINASLFKLHHNFLYLNAQTKIASNNFPARYRGYIASTKITGSSGVDWYSTSTATNYLSTQLSAYGDGTTSNSTVLSGIVDGAFTQSLGTKSSYVGFVANSASLIAIQSNDVDQDAFVRLNVRNIEDSTALSFTEIRSLAINSNKNLFVVDDVLVHKFDVRGVLTDNPATSAIGRFLIKTIGGISKNIFDKDKFKLPVAVDIGKDDKVYILDKGDGGYKVFDKDLNWLSTSSKTGDFSDQLLRSPVTDISVDIETEDVYILSENGIILQYDVDGFLIGTHTLLDSIATDEKFKKIAHSRIDDNIVYVLTDKTLFKKFKSKLTKSIGAFRLESKNINNGRLSFIDVMDTDNVEYDYVFMGGENVFTNVDSDVGAIFKFDEKTNFKTISRDSYKTDIFTLSAISVNNTEYVTSWTINKSIHKLVYNHLIFRDSIFGKYIGKYDGFGRSEYVDVDYLLDTDKNLFGFITGTDQFIGINEVVLSQTLNRTLEQIFDLQADMLEMCNEKYTNVFPLGHQVVGL